MHDLPREKRFDPREIRNKEGKLSWLIEVCFAVSNSECSLIVLIQDHRKPYPYLE